MKFDALTFLETLCSPDPVVIKPAQPDPVAAGTQTRPNKLDQLSDAERSLYPADLEPPDQHVRMVLAVREIFGGTVVAVSAPSGEPDIRPDDLFADWAEWFAERAAIREYCGNQNREHAEAGAMKETRAAMRAAGE